MDIGDIRFNFKCLGCGEIRLGVKGSMNRGLGDIYDENRYCDTCGGDFFTIYHEASYGRGEGTSEVWRDDEYKTRRESYLTEYPQYKHQDSTPRLPALAEKNIMYFYCACGHQWDRPDLRTSKSDQCMKCREEVPPKKCPACHADITANIKEFKYVKTHYLTRYRVEEKCCSNHHYLFGYCVVQTEHFVERRKNP